MSEPASPNGEKAAENEAATVSPALPIVSIPDRQRIDSDVRAFLREPSTPWIVFDQEGRPPSQLAVGEMLPMRAAVLSDAGFFPAIAAIDAVASASRLEPSSVAVASDVLADPNATGARLAVSAEVDAGVVAPAKAPRPRFSGRVLGIAAATVAMLVTVVIGSLVAKSFSSGDELASVAPPATASARAQAASAPESPPSSFDVSEAAAKLAEQANAVAAATAAAPAPPPVLADDPAKTIAKRYGRLTVSGDAKSRDVYMDGKRMLGKGARSFTIMCGTHTIAVGARTDTREVEVPCTGNAELVITN